jgi:hypothetical protein
MDSNMKPSATLVLADHRPEVIPLAQKLMATHDRVILEEPADDRFEAMLDGSFSVEDYLEDQDLEYPQFSRCMAHVLRERHLAGTRLVQVEPFIEVLLAIHDRFANGERPQDLPAGTDLHRVYLAERRATAALLDFYKAAAGDRFEAVVNAVKRFARADARRFALRDRMRARAIVKLISTGKTYIEAGSIHYPLWRELRQRLPGGYPLRVHFLLAGVAQKMGFRKYLFGPGDVLTLHYRFHPKGFFPTEDILAARALIYNKLILKEEISTDEVKYPHTRDALAVGGVSARLSLADCRRLYPMIRHASTTTSRRIVSRYLGKPWTLNLKL